jgi:hypothetical protein
LREVFCSVLEFREEKRTFVKVEGGNVNFFLSKKGQKLTLLLKGRDGGLEGWIVFSKT